MALSQNQVLLDGKYRIVRLLGEGGMSRVWLAQEPNFNNRQVAIKDPKLQASSFDSIEIQRRFQQEIALSGQLLAIHASNIVPALTVEMVDGAPLLVMFYADDGSAADKIIANPSGLPIEQAVAITTQVCQALQTLHSLPGEPVHRDVKPSNILLTSDGRVLLSDFGLAQLQGASGRTRLNAGHHPGTPQYMAPEQESGTGYLTPAADLFALGCVLFEMLTGKRYKAQRAGIWPSQLRPEVPAWLDSVVAKAVATHPADRFQTATEFSQALQSKSVVPASAKQDTASKQAAATNGAGNASPLVASPAPPKGGNRIMLWEIVLEAIVTIIALVSFLWPDKVFPSRADSLVMQSILVAGKVLVLTVMAAIPGRRLYLANAARSKGDIAGERKNNQNALGIVAIVAIVVVAFFALLAYFDRNQQASIAPPVAANPVASTSTPPTPASESSPTLVATFTPDAAATQWASLHATETALALLAITQTAAVEPTVTPTRAPAATTQQRVTPTDLAQPATTVPSSTPLPVVVPTVAPTAVQPTTPTPRLAATARPAPTPTTSVKTYPAPQLMSPADGTTFDSGQPAILQWKSAGTLALGDHYLLAVQHQGGTDWTVTDGVSWQTPAWMTCDPLPKGCEWWVAVVRGAEVGGYAQTTGQVVSEPGTLWRFGWSSPSGGSGSPAEPTPPVVITPDS